jgi:hypothetical protein
MKNTRSKKSRDTVPLKSGYTEKRKQELSKKILLSCPSKKCVSFESHTINIFRSILQPSAMSIFEKSSNISTTLQSPPSFLFTAKHIIETCSK